MSTLLTDTTDHILTITLNRPQSRNALSDDLIAELTATLQQAGQDDNIRVVILAAAGGVFCAGHDLREVRGKQTVEEYRELFVKCSAMMQAIVSLPKPVIAQVQGMATAAGCQLVASCDVVIASEEARFATPGVHIGLFCSTPMVALSRKVGHSVALKMLLLGEPLPATEAQAAGLVTAVVASDDLPATTRVWATKIASKSPLTLAIGKEAFYRQAEMPLAQAYDYCSEVMAQNMTKNDAQEGIAAFVEKRAAVWTNT